MKKGQKVKKTKIIAVFLTFMCFLFSACSNDADKYVFGEVSLGFLTSNNEFRQEWTPIVQHGHTAEELKIYKHSKGAVTIRVELEKNKHTKDVKICMVTLDL